MKKKTTKWEDFCWFLYMQKLKVIMRWIDVKNVMLRFKHCRKGFHRFEKNHIHISVGGAGYTKGWSRKTEFFECRTCGLLAFTTKKDRNNWIFIKKREDNVMKKCFDHMAKDLKNKKSKK